MLSATTSTKLFTILHNNHDNSKSVVPLDGPTQNSDHANNTGISIKIAHNNAPPHDQHCIH